MAKLEKISDTSWKQLLIDRTTYGRLSVHKDIAADFKLAGKDKIWLRIEFSENLNHTPITDEFTIINANGRAINLRGSLKSWLEELSDKQRHRVPRTLG